MEEEKEPSDFWGETTDPKEHNPNEFRYLVHAFNPLAKISQIMLAANNKNSQEAIAKQSIDLTNFPERLAERVSLSMSLIDQDHTGTWGNSGIIVNAPRDNLVLTSASDVGTFNTNIESLQLKKKAKDLLPPDVLLKGTSRVIHNEVVAFGTHDESKLILSGFFIKVDEDNIPIDRHLASILRSKAKDLRLPLIEIVQENPYKEVKLEKSNKLVTATFNNRFYNLGGGDHFEFHAMNARRESYFPGLSEISIVLNFFSERGDISDDDINSIVNNYLEFDKKRQSFRLEFNTDNKLNLVRFLRGYGSLETKYTFTTLGAWSQNLKDESREGMERLVGGGLTGFSSRVPIKSSMLILEVDEMKVKNLIDEETYNLLVDFYNQYKAAIDSQPQTRNSTWTY